MQGKQWESLICPFLDPRMDLLTQLTLCSFRGNPSIDKPAIIIMQLSPTLQFQLHGAVKPLLAAHFLSSTLFPDATGSVLF